VIDVRGQTFKCQGREIIVDKDSLEIAGKAAYPISSQGHTSLSDNGVISTLEISLLTYLL